MPSTYVLERIDFTNNLSRVQYEVKHKTSSKAVKGFKSWCAVGANYKLTGAEMLKSAAMWLTSLVSKLKKLNLEVKTSLKAITAE